METYRDKGIVLISAFEILIGVIITAYSLSMYFLGESVFQSLIFGMWMAVILGVLLIIAGILLYINSPFGWGLSLILFAIHILIFASEIAYQEVTISTIISLITSLIIVGYLILKKNLFVQGIYLGKGIAPESPSKMLVRESVFVIEKGETGQRFVKNKHIEERFVKSKH